MNTPWRHSCPYPRTLVPLVAYKHKRAHGRSSLLNPRAHALRLQVKGGPELHGGAHDSAAKLAAVDALCSELGVHTAPLRLGRLWVVPVLSWHHKVGPGSTREPL